MASKRLEVSSLGQHTGNKGFLSRPVRFFKQLFEGVTFNKVLKYLVFVNWFIILGLLSFIIYHLVTNENSYIISIKGWQDAHQYRKLSKERETLLQENKDFNQENIEIRSKLTSGSDLTFEKKIALTGEFISNTREVKENLNEIEGLDQKLLSLDLPDQIVERIVESSEEALMYRQNLSSAIIYYQAQQDYLELRNQKTNLDTCIKNVNYGATDAQIANAIDVCIEDSATLTKKLEEIEKNYEVDLTKIDNYIELNLERWVALRNFYQSAAQENFEEEKKYDEQYIKKKEELESSDTEMVWFEYKEKVLDPFSITV